MQLLLISNSTNAGQPYLSHCIENIKNFLGKTTNVVFIPYAAVTFSYDQYETKVKEKFNSVGLDIKSIHNFDNKIKAVEDADAIVVGGGNTFMLLHLLYQNNLIEPIRQKALNNTPYIGWSAGSNMACPTLKTTNDMPIVEPESFDALNLISFQINPHYLDTHPQGHAGETRQMRIEEFIAANKEIYVVGLREGTMLHVIDNNIQLIGERNARIFKFGIEPIELSNEDNFSFLIKI